MNEMFSFQTAVFFHVTCPLRQSIYKTQLDFASPLAYSKNLKKSNTTVHTVGTIKGMCSPISTHSIDQFSPTPYMVHADGTVSVKRQTAKQSIKNGIKHTVTYHPVGKAVVSVTDRLPSLAYSHQFGSVRL